MEVGLKQAWKKTRAEERKVKGAGLGEVGKEGRKARVMYVQCRTGKGNLQASRPKIGQVNKPSIPEVWKISGDRKARRLGLYAWGADRAEVGDMGRYG